MGVLLNKAHRPHPSTTAPPFPSSSSSFQHHHHSSDVSNTSSTRNSTHYLHPGASVRSSARSSQHTHNNNSSNNSNYNNHHSNINNNSSNSNINNSNQVPLSSPLAANARPSMDVKSLISFFNHKCKPPVEVIISQDTIPEPIYTPNGKVKHLVSEFSRSPRSPRSLATTASHTAPPSEKSRTGSNLRPQQQQQQAPGGNISEINSAQHHQQNRHLPNRHGGDAAEPGVLQEPGPPGFVSRQTDGAGLVSPIQHQGTTQHQQHQHQNGEGGTQYENQQNNNHHQYQQQFKEPQETSLGVAPVVDESTAAAAKSSANGEHGRRRTAHRAAGAAARRVHHPAPGIIYSSAATSTFEVSRITGMSPDGAVAEKDRDGRRYDRDHHHHHYQQRSPAVTSLSRIQNLSTTALSPPERRVGSVESVVVSARNSVLRKLRFTGLLSPNPKPRSGVSGGVVREGEEGIGEVDEKAEVDVEVMSDFEEDFSARLETKSTDPPPLKIVKAKKADPVTGITHGSRSRATAAAAAVAVATEPSEKRPTHLAPPSATYKKKSHSTIRPLSPQSSGHSKRSHRRRHHSPKPFTTEQSRENEVAGAQRSGLSGEGAYDDIPTYVPNHYMPPTFSDEVNITIRDEEELMAARNARKRERTRANRRSQPVVLPYYLPERLEKPYKTVPRPGAPRRKIYEDVEWRKHGRFVLRGNVDEERDNLSSRVHNNKLDGTTGSVVSWSSYSRRGDHRTHPYLQPTRAMPQQQQQQQLPLTPPRGQFRSYILNPEDTAGQFHGHGHGVMSPGEEASVESGSGDRKAASRRGYGPEKSLAEELKYQRNNPRFATFHKLDPFVDDDEDDGEMVSPPLSTHRLMGVHGGPRERERQMERERERERVFIRSPSSAVRFRMHLDRADLYAQGQGRRGYEWFGMVREEEGRRMRGSPVSIGRSSGRSSGRRGEREKRRRGVGSVRGGALV